MFHSVTLTTKYLNRLNGLEIKNKYLSISDKQRLSETRKYF